MLTCMLNRFLIHLSLSSFIIWSWLLQFKNTATNFKVILEHTRLGDSITDSMTLLHFSLQWLSWYLFYCSILALLLQIWVIILILLLLLLTHGTFQVAVYAYWSVFAFGRWSARVWACIVICCANCVFVKIYIQQMIKIAQYVSQSMSEGYRRMIVC